MRMRMMMTMMVLTKKMMKIDCINFPVTMIFGTPWQWLFLGVYALDIMFIMFVATHLSLWPSG